MLVDKTVIAPHPHKIDKDGRRHYLVRTRSTKTAGATISSAQDRQRRHAPPSHPHKIDKDGRRHYLIRAIPYQDPEMEAERLKAVHEARVKIIPRV
jgi:hypothetical protein